MSGHSKWATIKHKKGAADKARGKLFAKLIRQVEVAAREGGGDPDINPTLRTMFQKARDASVPIDTIERAIKRGTGELEGVIYESITYEGYAPGGVAVLVEVLTDNRNRTGAEVRNAVLQERRVDGRARRGGVAVRAQGHRAGRPGGRRGRADARSPSTPAPRTSPTTARPGGSPPRRPTSTPCAPRSRRPASRSTSSELHDGADRPSIAARRRRRRPSRCCASSTPSRTTTTCRTSTPTSTSPTTSSRRSRPDGRRRSAQPAPGLHARRAATTPTTGRRAYSLAELPRAGGGARLLPGRQHPGLHPAAERLHRRHRLVRARSAPRCWPSARSRSQSHDEFSCKQGGFAFPLLADTDKAVGEAYGILGPLGFYRRSVFVIDGDGHRPLRPPGRRRPHLPAPPTSCVEAVRAPAAGPLTARRPRRGGGLG